MEKFTNNTIEKVEFSKDEISLYSNCNGRMEEYCRLEEKLKNTLPWTKCIVNGEKVRFRPEDIFEYGFVSEEKTLTVLKNNYNYELIQDGEIVCTIFEEENFISYLNLHTKEELLSKYEIEDGEDKDIDEIIDEIYYDMEEID